jgi:uncharacterized Zn finger protein (UPF0148 family)
VTGRRCPLCGAVVYGRSDKIYCSSTCRRDACRIRERVIRLGGVTFTGRELSQSHAIEAVLIPRYERRHGANRAEVQRARHLAERHREEEYEFVRRAMERVAEARRRRREGGGEPPSESQ